MHRKSRLGETVEPSRRERSMSGTVRKAVCQSLIVSVEWNVTDELKLLDEDKQEGMWVFLILLVGERCESTCHEWHGHCTTLCVLQRS